MFSRVQRKPLRRPPLISARSLGGLKPHSTIEPSQAGARPRRRRKVRRVTAPVRAETDAAGCWLGASRLRPVNATGGHAGGANGDPGSATGIRACTTGRHRAWREGIRHMRARTSPDEGERWPDENLLVDGTSMEWTRVVSVQESDTIWDLMWRAAADPLAARAP
jgi:hypothetical protein